MPECIAGVNLLYLKVQIEGATADTKDLDLHGLHVDEVRGVKRLPKSYPESKLLSEIKNLRRWILISLCC